jgi:hypothetical protein
MRVAIAFSLTLGLTLRSAEYAKAALTVIREMVERIEAWLLAIESLSLNAALILVAVGLAIGAILLWLRLPRMRGPRRLSRETKAALSAALGGRCPNTFPVSCRAEDNEAKTYADDFVEALRRGGCDAILKLEARLRPDATGVFIVIDRDRSIAGAELLARAMRSADIDFQVAFDSDRLAERLAGPDGFALIIGRLDY